MQSIQSAMKCKPRLHADQQYLEMVNKTLTRKAYLVALDFAVFKRKWSQKAQIFVPKVLSSEALRHLRFIERPGVPQFRKKEDHSPHAVDHWGGGTLGHARKCRHRLRSPSHSRVTRTHSKRGHPRLEDQRSSAALCHLPRPTAAPSGQRTQSVPAVRPAKT
jgi:hypothetical protein